MVDFLERIKFHICALESASREVLEAFKQERPDVACEILSGTSGPYSVLIKEEKGREKVVMALYDSQILTQAELYIASYAELYDDIVITGINATRFGDNVQRLINSFDDNRSVQVYVTETEDSRKPSDYRHSLDIMFERDVAA